MQRIQKLFNILIVLFIIWLILFRANKEMASYQELSLATAIYFVCCLPLLIYFLRSEKNIPYLPVFGIFYFIYFGLSVFSNYDLIMQAYLSPRIIIKCLNLALWGFISLMIAFYTPIGKPIDSIVIPVKIPWNPNRAYRISIFIGLLGIVVHYFSLTKAMPLIYSGMVNFIVSLSRLSIAILFMLNLQNRLNFNGKIFLWLGLFIPTVLLDIITGSTASVILNFMILFFLHFYYFRSIPWLKIAVGLLTFFLIFSARDRFRDLVWYGEYMKASPVEKGILYVKLIYERFLGGHQYKYEEVYEKLSIRTDNLITFANVVQMTPDAIPFWGGYTYSTLITSFIPRILMPEKPKKILGTEFGHRYRFLPPEDISTSYNLPLVVEMYVNFGTSAIIIGMFILGFIYRIFYNLFNHPAAGDGGFLLSAMIFINLLNIESDFSLVFGNIIQYIIFFYIVIKRMKLPIERIDIEKMEDK